MNSIFARVFTKEIKQMTNTPTKSTRTLIAVAVVCLVSVTGVAIASTHKASDKLDKILNNVYQEGQTAEYEVNMARVAIFDGQPDKAEKLLEQAKANLAKAQAHAPKITVTVKTVETMGKKTIDSNKSVETTDYIPFNAYLSVSEDFIASPDKVNKIKKANDHLKKGEHQQAIEALKDDDIGVSVTQQLMPLKSTVAGVNESLKLLKEHKFYKANLALKGAADGVVSETVLLNEPLQAKKDDGKS